MMAECKICNKKILRHNRQIVCENCKHRYHIQCTALNIYDLEKIDISTWYCVNCNEELFAYNQTIDVDEFIGRVKNISDDMSLIENMLFDSFDMNTDQEETDDNLDDINPDQYYRHTSRHKY